MKNSCIVFNTQNELYCKHVMIVSKDILNVFFGAKLIIIIFLMGTSWQEPTQNCKGNFSLLQNQQLVQTYVQCAEEERFQH